MIRPRIAVGTSVVATHYDDLDQFYLKIWGEHVHHGLWFTGQEDSSTAVLQLSRYVAEQANIESGTKVCDVGCGYGATARLLASEYGAQVTALTITPSQYEYAVAQSTHICNPQFLLRNWLENGLDSDSYDAVIAIESTEHMPDLKHFFLESARVLKSEGRLVVCAWLTNERPLRWQVLHLLEPICREGRLVGMGSESDYRRLFKEVGLELVSLVDVSRQVRRTWLLCIARTLRSIALDPETRRFLLNRRQKNRVFALTLFRLWLAYYVGAMRYVVFTATKPSA
jgi:tocopherol O-methyltransferase